ncbi:MAG: hypothetical protein AAFZ65_10825, partial [Planctomycetota bacterium]
SGNEIAIPGFPLLYTSIDTGAFFVLPGSISIDAGGSGSIQYSNPAGSGLGFVVQAILFDPLVANFVASTNGADL